MNVKIFFEPRSDSDFETTIHYDCSNSTAACPLPLSIYCLGQSITHWLSCQFSLYKTETQLSLLVSYRWLYPSWMPDVVITSSIFSFKTSIICINRLIYIYIYIRSPRACCRLRNPTISCNLLLMQCLDHVRITMNKLYPNCGRDTSCSPESPVLFLPPPLDGV